jgi:cobalt/nickel transport system permease protein
VHIPDGILPAQVCAAGYAITGLATWYSLRQINRKPDPTAEIPKASLLTAAFFVASSIYIPIPPASVHLILNGLLGVVLGYFAFPAILIGLLFQALVIGHGGLTTLGVNAAMMGIPALLAYHIFQLRLSIGKGLPEKVATASLPFWEAPWVWALPP